MPSFSLYSISPLVKVKKYYHFYGSLDIRRIKWILVGHHRGCCGI